MYLCYLVKIGMTQCPWDSTISPWWYQLEVAKGNVTGATESRQNHTNVSSTRVLETDAQSNEGVNFVPETPIITSGEGVFTDVRRNHEIQLCNFNSVSFTAIFFNINEIFIIKLL